jgi:exopolyphosphatase / guanosine-5'-triphosphate,3'-diphosphate pyrophosphatase
MERRVAVIDIGSNTIKLLVAEREVNGSGIVMVSRRTIEARLGQGISASLPVFSPEVIERGTLAVAQLVEQARARDPEVIQIVATSAVRDAANREDFIAAVRRRTGLDLEVLSGEREAELIGGAIRLDPAITADSFYVFDLGGGSLECLRFRQRELEQVVSLPLGCVRVAEKEVVDASGAFTPGDEERVSAEVRRVMAESGFGFSLPKGALAVGTGGTLTSSLEILAGERGVQMEDVPRFLSKGDLRHLLERIGGVSLAQRLEIKGVSPGRADVFPTALATFLTLVDLTSTQGIHHSLLNLRYGLAAELLGVQA